MTYVIKKLAETTIFRLLFRDAEIRCKAKSAIAFGQGSETQAES